MGNSKNKRRMHARRASEPGYMGYTETRKSKSKGKQTAFEKSYKQFIDRKTT